jgi:hypothetical protein
MLNMYRAVGRDELGTKFEYLPTRRVPGNVPYLVDNLWEWDRPKEFPSRRHAVFASPTPKIALAAVSTVVAERAKYVVRMVTIPGRARIVQLREKDAKFHPDVRTLPKLVLSVLEDNWAQLPVTSRLDIAALFLPAATHEEIEEVLGRIPEGEALREKIAQTSTFWKGAKLLSPGADALKYARGEIFFEALDGYTLGPPVA